MRKTIVCGLLVAAILSPICCSKGDGSAINGGVFLNGTIGPNNANYTSKEYINKINYIKAGYLDGLWNGVNGWYAEGTEPYGVLNAHILRTTSILAMLGKASDTDKTRAKTVVDKFFSGVCYNGVTWTSDLDGGALHEAHDQVISEGLYFAWLARAQLGLTAGQISNIVNALTVDGVTTLYGGHILSDPEAQKDNQNQSKWGLNRWTYAKLVSGGASFDNGISTLIKNFANHIDNAYGTPNTGSNPLTALYPDFGWRYIEAFAGFHSFEYGTMALGGALVFYPQISTAAGLNAGEILKLKAWERHYIGQWTHSGYPNWDTIWSWGRLHVSNYWFWSLRSLLGIAKNTGLNQGTNDYLYAKWMLDRSIDLHTRMDAWSGDAVDGAIAGDPYGLDHSGVGGGYVTYAKSTANAMYAAELAFAVYSGIADSVSMEPVNLWGWNKTSMDIHVSTRSYSAASLPNAPICAPPGWPGTDSVQMQNWGVSRIAHVSGEILTGFGGTGEEAFHLKITKDGATEIDTSVSIPTAQQVSRDGIVDSRGDYDTDAVPTEFSGSIKEECSGAGSNYSLGMTTYYYPSHIRQEVVITRTGTPGTGRVELSIPLRKTAIVDYVPISGDTVVVWNRPTMIEAGSPSPSTCKYIHAKWATKNAGLLLIPQSGTLAGGAKVTMTAVDPSGNPRRQPDQDRSILLWLAYDAGNLGDLSYVFDLYVTDGTDEDAVSIYNGQAS